MHQRVATLRLDASILSQLLTSHQFRVTTYYPPFHLPSCAILLCQGEIPARLRAYRAPRPAEFRESNFLKNQRFCARWASGWKRSASLSPEVR